MDFKKLFRKDDKAVSPVIGVILMVAITVILAAAIGSSVFSHGTAKSAPQASLDIQPASYTNGSTANAGIRVEHLGGDTINFSKDVTKATATFDGNAVDIDVTALGNSFAVGNVKTIELKNATGPITVTGKSVNIKFIDSQTNQLICDKNVRF
jgi:flagellin-like protein